jgi:hypothetical protein
MILFYGVGIRGLLARTSFRPVESEYRVIYSRFTGQKNRGSVRHALRTYIWSRRPYCASRECFVRLHRVPWPAPLPVAVVAHLRIVELRGRSVERTRWAPMATWCNVLARMPASISSMIYAYAGVEVFVCSPPRKLLIAELTLISCILAVSFDNWIWSGGWNWFVYDYGVNLRKFMFACLIIVEIYRKNMKI